MQVEKLSRAAVILGMASLLSACAAIDFKHPELEAKWAKGGPALAGADYLKVYDDELARLADHARVDDQSVVHRLVACRDASVAKLLSAAELPEPCNSPRTAPASTGPALLQQLITDRLQQTVGGGFSAPGGINRLSDLKTVIDAGVKTLGLSQFLLDNARLIYAQQRAAPTRAPVTRGAPAAGAKPFDTSCDALKKVDIATATNEGAAAIQVACANLDQNRHAVQKVLEAQIGASSGTDCSAPAALAAAAPIVQLYCRIWGDPPGGAGTTSVDTASALESDLVNQLSKDVPAAKAANTASQDGLKAFGVDLQAAIDALPSGYAKVDALEHLSTIVDAISRADVCNEKAEFDQATITAAKCDSISATPLAAKASDAWAFLHSLALLSDATNPASRSAQWLAGAQAIVAAQKADAKLQAAYDQAELAAARQRFDAMVIEATQDAKALQFLRDSANHRCSSRAFDCALPLYIDATNRGAIPATLLAGRSDQLAREYAVRRERAAADRESKLLIAASDQLEAGTKAGIDRGALLTLIASSIVAVATLAQ